MEKEEKIKEKLKGVFETLNNINVNDHTETKEGLTYLTWSWAWAEVLKVYPDATYNILRFENNLPYVFDEKTGYMVFTNVTIDEITREMWLPVMDSKNKTMLDHEYTYLVKGNEKTVNPATMFDINKTIMRCLVKNLAMFGLGLYIYAGEDLPEAEQSELDKPASSELIEKVKKAVGEKRIPAMLKYYKIKKIEELRTEDAEALIAKHEAKQQKAEEQKEVKADENTK